MWLVGLALGQELPWECPPVAEPADALPLRTDAGVDALLDALEDEALAWWEEGCAWTVVEDDEVREQWCVTSEGAEVSYWTRAWSGEGRGGGEASTLIVVLPPGAATWTEITVVEESLSAESAFGGGTATWTGSVAGAPDDGFVTREASYDGETLAWSRDYTTPDCAWSYGDDGVSWRLRTVDRSVRVDYLRACSGDSDANTAYVDGVLFGSVDPDTWELDEIDRDGFAVHDGDCDDADPVRHPCAEVEVPCDVVDDDCVGGNDCPESSGCGGAHAFLLVGLTAGWRVRRRGGRASGAG